MFVTWACMFVLILCPLSFNIMKLNPGKDVRYMSNEDKSRLRFEPFRIFEQDLKFSKGDIVLISKDIHQRSWMLGRSRDNAQCNMLNIYFNEHFDYDQVVDGEVTDILKADYDYAIVTGFVLKQAQATNQQGFMDIVRKYEIVKKPEAFIQTRSGPMQLLLLKKKS